MSGVETITAAIEHCNTLAPACIGTTKLRTILPEAQARICCADFVNSALCPFQKRFFRHGVKMLLCWQAADDFHFSSGKFWNGRMSTRQHGQIIR